MNSGSQAVARDVAVAPSPMSAAIRERGCKTVMAETREVAHRLATAGLALPDLERMVREMGLGARQAHRPAGLEMAL